MLFLVYLSRLKISENEVTTRYPDILINIRLYLELGRIADSWNVKHKSACRSQTAKICFLYLFIGTSPEFRSAQCPSKNCIMKVYGCNMKNVACRPNDNSDLRCIGIETDLVQANIVGFKMGD